MGLGPFSFSSFLSLPLWAADMGPFLFFSFTGPGWLFSFSFFHFFFFFGLRREGNGSNAAGLCKGEWLWTDGSWSEGCQFSSIFLNIPASLGKYVATSRASMVDPRRSVVRSTIWRHRRHRLGEGSSLVGSDWAKDGRDRGGTAAGAVVLVLTPFQESVLRFEFRAPNGLGFWPNFMNVVFNMPSLRVRNFIWGLYSKQRRNWVSKTVPESVSVVRAPHGVSLEKFI